MKNFDNSSSFDLEEKEVLEQKLTSELKIQRANIKLCDLSSTK